MDAKRRRSPRRLTRRLPAQAAPVWRPLIEIARNVGIGACGTRGVGKSTLLFLFAWLDTVIFNKSLVAILPTSNVFDLLATNIALLHPDDQAALWPHIRYVPLSGYEVVPNSPVSEWYVLPTGLYAPSGVGVEDASTISQRLPEIMLRLEPNLTEATQLGYKAIWNASMHAGRILCTLGLGVTHMANLLTQFDSPVWQRRMNQAVAKDPSIGDAVAFFRNEYATWTPGRRDERTYALMTRLSTFSSPLMQAQFGPSFWAVHFKDVFDRQQRLKVFYDISHEHTDDSRNFKMLFLFTTLVDAIKRHGAANAGDRSHPLSVIIDEIAVMIGGKTAQLPKTSMRSLTHIVGTIMSNL